VQPKHIKIIKKDFNSRLVALTLNENLKHVGTYNVQTSGRNI